MSKNSISAREVLPEEKYQSFIGEQHDHTRRTLDATGASFVETIIKPSDLWQSVDIAVEENFVEKREIPSLPNYYLFDRDGGARFIEECMQLGLSGIMLRPTSTAKQDGRHVSEDAMRRAVDNTAAIVSMVKDRMGQHALAVDPFDLLDLRGPTWGVFGKGAQRNRIDSTRTYDAIAHMAAVIGQARADIFMTIGRLREEVLVARASLDKHAPSTKLGSFPANNETRLAYSHACHTDSVHRCSQQKIPVGNFHEMVVRTLADMAEGVELALTKPSSNTHVNALLTELLSGETALDSYLQRAEVQTLLDLDPMLAKHIEKFRERQAAIMESVKIGSYVVSGTYAYWRSLKGQLSYTLAHEHYSNAVAASRPLFGCIADRFAHQFVKYQNYWGTPEGY
ncbi:MAG: hypothetical protein PHS73_00565 [Candidatus Peribacteraceae bacterium]|nr:hypothetical protein [Candidatus Peribacteraceae bacterium]